MNITKKELYEHVDSLEKQIEANQDKMIEYQERIEFLDKINAKLTGDIRRIMTKVRAMKDGE